MLRKLRKSHILFFIVIAFVTLAFVPNSFAQQVGVIYFLPNDRTTQSDIDSTLDSLIKEAQQFYADVMESNGFGRKTFGLETDTNGNVVVHHVKGEFNDTYYHSGTLGKVIGELSPKFDTSNNIYFLAIDISSEKFDVNRPNSHICGQSSGKWAATPASGICFNYSVIAHELGHSFGLSHDRFNYSGIDAMVDSFCSAEWLDVHPYFNEGSQTDFNENTAINMLPPSRAPSSTAVRFSFEVRDADGLHQAQLFITTLDSVAACKRLNSKSTTIEFDTTYVVSGLNSITLKVIDVNGNHTHHDFPVDISNFLLLPKKVTIPDANLAAAIRAYTDLPPNAEITTETMVRLTRLYTGPDTPIADITGLEYAVNLVALSLYRQNTITDFSALSGLRELRFLELPGTGISDISVLSALTKLQILYLQSNTIQDISALAGLTNLKKLELRNNDISNITPLAGLTTLTYLDLGSNQISDVRPLVGLRNLNTLYLQSNTIQDISALAGLTNLKKLELWNNDISNITPLAGLTTLTYLDLRSNQISDVRPLVGLRNLNTLYLWGNPIEDFSPLRILLANNPNLKIDIDIPDPPPLAFSLSTIADQTFEVDRTIQALTLPEAIGGTTPYTYNISGLPAGLQFDTTTRVLSGTPTTAGTTTATYTATDAASVSASLTFTITVGAKPTFNPGVIADQTFTVGEPVNLTLPTAIGGSAPYTYTLFPIPEGLDFDAAAQTLTGTATTVGTTQTTYAATDATGVSAALIFTIEVTGNNLDVNGNGKVNVIDLVLVAAAYGERGTGIPADVNADGIVNIQDLIAVAAGIDASGAALPQAVKEAVVAEVGGLEAIAEAPRGLNSAGQGVAAGIVYSNVVNALADVRHLATSDQRLGKWVPLLEELLHRLTEIQEIPDTTALLLNYPNPFNPETWIPYHLATDAEVTLTIYDVRGSMVRELRLGHQPAGVYESRGRAAYWDGKNELGEPVASGVYFYTLTAGDFTATRKMLIRK